ncbi:MAG: hypothetical protein IJX17_02940 [Clostridia bacterium]|nr:hypothetical protein [Clostridia bacterium]
MNYFLLESSNFNTLSIIQYIVDVLIMMIIMCMLVYLTFSIVKKNQISDKFDNNDLEQRIIKDKIDVKNQIEMVQNGIVMVDQETFIIPARRNALNFIYDEYSPKIKHLNSLNYEEYDVFNNSFTVNENTIIDNINNQN